MNDSYSNVSIRTLEDMIVASYRVISKNPEEEVIAFMNSWLERRGLNNQTAMRNFGFDVQVNKQQSNDGLRGYEYWVTVPAATLESDGVKIKSINADEYAVLRITNPFSNPFELIPNAWKILSDWVMNSEYKTTQFSGRCWLEEVVQQNGTTFMDLYFPVKEGFRKPASELIEFKVVELEDCMLIGKELRCKMGNPEGNPIPDFWTSCFQDGTMDLLENHKDRIYRNATIGWMDEFDMQENTFSYIVGVFVKKDAEIPTGMSFRKSIGAKYAVGTIKGNEPDIFMNAHSLTEQAMIKEHINFDYEKYVEMEWYDERFCQKIEYKIIDLYMKIK